MPFGKNISGSHCAVMGILDSKFLLFAQNYEWNLDGESCCELEPHTHTQTLERNQRDWEKAGVNMTRRHLVLFALLSSPLHYYWTEEHGK